MALSPAGVAVMRAFLQARCRRCLALPALLRVLSGTRHDTHSGHHLITAQLMQCHLQPASARHLAQTDISIVFKFSFMVRFLPEYSGLASAGAEFNEGQFGVKLREGFSLLDLIELVM